MLYRLLTSRQHMAEKAPCHVWKGNNRLHGLHMREMALLIAPVSLSQLIFARKKHLKKHIKLTLFRLHLRPKTHTFVPVPSAEENSLCVSALGFFFFPPDIHSVYPNMRKSLFIKTRFSFFSAFVCVFLFLVVLLFFLRLKVKRRRGFYLRSLASLRLKSLFLIDCVFDPETG